MTETAAEPAKTTRLAILRARTLDRLEQGVVLVLYFLLAGRFWPDSLSAVNLASVLLLVSEGAVVVFLIIRKPTENISMRPGDWAIATAGTFLPMLVERGGAHLLPIAGGLIILVGTCVHIGAKFSLNNSFGLVAANRGVKRIGPYRLVRHPMYAGYILTHIGFLLAQFSLFNLALYMTVWAIMVLRIRAEERVLFDDAAYREFAEKVRCRLIPGLY